MADNYTAEMDLRLLMKAVIQEHGEDIAQDKLIRSLRDRIGFELATIPLLEMIRIRAIASEVLSSTCRIKEGDGR